MYFSCPLRGLESSTRCSGGTAANTRPASSIGRMYRWNRVSSRVLMCAPSTSASDIRITRW